MQELDKGITYQIIILGHLQLISQLSSQVINEKEKQTTFEWQLMIFEGFVPEELKDKIYKEKIKELEKETKYKSGTYDYLKERFNILINLLGRKNLLYDKRQEFKSSQKDKYITEEWENN